MEAFIILILFSSIYLGVESFDANCPTVKCGDGAPDIRFPFRVKGQQPQHCGYPGFELVCKENNTIIQFPSHGDLVVKSISYDIKKLDLYDPKYCVYKVFFDLNLSLTPFNYYYEVKNYTYLNCSAGLSPTFTQVPCLSGFGHHVYIVEPSLAVPVSCTPVKTVAIPFSYSPYLSSNSFGLGLTWDLPGFEDCEAEEGKCAFQSKTGHQTRCFNISDYKVLSMSIFIFAVVILISIKIYHSKKLDGQKEKENHLEVEKLGGDYNTLKPASNSINADIKGPGEQSV